MAGKHSNDGKTYVLVNESGRRIGEFHPRVRLIDHEIDLIWELHEQGMGYKEIAMQFEGSIKK